RVGRSEGTVKSWLYRGRRHLAGEMEEYAPMTPPKTAAAPPVKPPARTPAKPAAIVHTDLDDALIRKLREGLRAAGYAPRVVEPGDLFSLAEALRGYAFIVLDEWLDGRPSLELMLHMKADSVGAAIPVCMLCAGPSDFTVSAYWVAGVDRLINKNNA